MDSLQGIVQQVGSVPVLPKVHVEDSEGGGPQGVEERRHGADRTRRVAGHGSEAYGVRPLGERRPGGRPRHVFPGDAAIDREIGLPVRSDGHVDRPGGMGVVPLNRSGGQAEAGDALHGRIAQAVQADPARDDPLFTQE